MYILINIHHGCSNSERIIGVGTKEELLVKAKEDFDDNNEPDYPIDEDFAYYLMPTSKPFFLDEMSYDDKLKF